MRILGLNSVKTLPNLSVNPFFMLKIVSNIKVTSAKYVWWFDTKSTLRSGSFVIYSDPVILVLYKFLNLYNAKVPNEKNNNRFMINQLPSASFLNRIFTLYVPLKCAANLVGIVENHAWNLFFGTFSNTWWITGFDIVFGQNLQKPLSLVETGFIFRNFNPTNYVCATTFAKWTAV